MQLKLNYEKYGNYLKKKRKEADFTQVDVADKVGFTAQFLSNAERGQCTLPLKTLRKLLRLYNTDPEEIISLIMKDYTEVLTNELTSNKPKRK